MRENEKKKMILVNEENKKVTVLAEIADNILKKARGLMFRDPRSLGENEGMLFTFNKDDYHGFWMLCTSMSLEAIFFDSKLGVVDIIQMERQVGILSCFKTYKPKQKARYVLEVNKGFSKKNNIKINFSKLLSLNL